MKNINMKGLIVALALVVSGGVAQAGDLKISGFFDAELNYQFSNSGTATFLSANQKNFTIGDTALRVSYEMDNVAMNIDLPFSVSNGVFGTQSKDQWNIKHSVSSMFSYTLGKFDRIFGFEENDSDGRAFFTTGVITKQANNIVTGSTTNASHLGLAADLAFDPIKLTILFANDSATTGNLGISRPEFGAKLGFGGKDGLRIEASYIAQSQGSSLIDAVIGLPLGSLALDIEWIMGMNAGTTAPMGFAGYFNYAMTDSLDLGLRGEYMLNQGGTSGTNTLGITAGPQYKLGKKTTLKADIMFASTTVASVSGSEFSASVGAVQKF